MRHRCAAEEANANVDYIQGDKGKREANGDAEEHENGYSEALGESKDVAFDDEAEDACCERVRSR